MRTVVLAVVLAATVAGCGAFDSDSTWKSGQFEVIWIDEPSDSHLSYRVSSTSLVQIVGACIVAAGANEQFIVVEQRPQGGGNTASYFIVSRIQYNPSKEPREVTLGPLSKADLEVEANRAALPALEEIMPSSMCRSAA